MAFSIVLTDLMKMVAKAQSVVSQTNSSAQTKNASLKHGVAMEKMIVKIIQMKRVVQPVQPAVHADSTSSSAQTDNAFLNHSNVIRNLIVPTIQMKLDA
jgi:hypothetical protein